MLHQQSFHQSSWLLDSLGPGEPLIHGQGSVIITLEVGRVEVLVCGDFNILGLQDVGIPLYAALNLLPGEPNHPVRVTDGEGHLLGLHLLLPCHGCEEKE